MMLRKIFFGAIAMLALSASPALSQNLYDPHPLAGVVDELRFGVHAHDVHHAMLPFLVNEWRLNQIEDISFDVLFTSPDIDAFRWIGAPRPEVGTTLNLDGKDSLLHAGLTWQLPVFDTPFYLEGTFGGAVHNGALENAAPGRKNFGCFLNFYERFGIGARLSDKATATITYEHTSNNNYCSQNDGLSNFGVRFGYKF